MADPAAKFMAAVVTVSDSCARGTREDVSGPAVAELLGRLDFSVCARPTVPDDKIQIQNLLIDLARSVRLIVTTGGTGIALRDVTPDATVAVCDRLIDGVAERMRAEGHKKNRIRCVEPWRLRSARNYTDSESAGEPCWRGRISGSRGRTDSARARTLSGNTEHA